MARLDFGFGILDWKSTIGQSAPAETDSPELLQRVSGTTIALVMWHEVATGRGGAGRGGAGRGGAAGRRGAGAWR